MATKFWLGEHASKIDGHYVGHRIIATKTGEWRFIKAYDGTSKIAILCGDWSKPPSLDEIQILND